MKFALRNTAALAALGAATLLAQSGAQAQATAAGDASCAPDGPISYICGVMNGEDIVRVGDTKWLLASSIAPLGGEVGAGRIYLIDSEAKTAEGLFPGAAPTLRHDAAMYPNCPGPLNLERWDSHGLALQETEPGVYRLYSTSHGAIEAIQAFELDARGDTPSATWVGCVPLPERMWANSVVILEDGGFRTTKFMDPTDPQAINAVFAGQPNGEVYEWRPGGAVQAIPGTELSGPNGIEMSPDGRWLFVAAFGGQRVARFDMSVSPPAKTEVMVPLNPDNLRWTGDGRLLTAGVNVVPPAECANPPCQTGWSAFAIDPEAMAAARVAGADQTAAIQGTATALDVDGVLWFGTYSGDRLGYMTAP
jgi:hypothetical protein